MGVSGGLLLGLLNSCARCSAFGIRHKLSSTATTAGPPFQAAQDSSAHHTCPRYFVEPNKRHQIDIQRHVVYSIGADKRRAVGPDGGSISTWNTVMMDCQKVSKLLRRSVSLPPKICIPSRAKMKMKRNKRKRSERMDWIELTRARIRLPMLRQYLQTYNRTKKSVLSLTTTASSISTTSGNVSKIQTKTKCEVYEIRGN